MYNLFRKRKQPKRATTWHCSEHDMVKGKLQRIEGELIVILIFLALILTKVLA